MWSVDRDGQCASQPPSVRKKVDQRRQEAGRPARSIGRVDWFARLAVPACRYRLARRSGNATDALWRMVEISVAMQPVDRLAVRAAVANSVLEGWHPTKVDLDRLAAFAAGAINMEQYRAGVVRHYLESER
jgi:hypothetical protein